MGCRLSFGLSDLQYLIQQLGPMTPEIVTIVQQDERRWQVELDGGVLVQLRWEASPPGLLIGPVLDSPEDGISPIEHLDADEVTLEVLKGRITERRLRATQAFERPVASIGSDERT